MNMSAMDMSPEWPAALLAWPVILAQTLIFGSALFSVMLNLHSDNQAQVGDISAQALAAWWRMLTLVIAVFSPLMLLDEAAGMAGVSMRNASSLIGEVLTQTHAGHIWMWRLPTAFALALAAWLPLRESARALVLVFLGAVF